MKRILFIVLTMLPFILLSCSDDKDEEKPPFTYDTIIGNTYVHYFLRSPIEYHFYTFNEDGTIDIEVRIENADGDLKGKAIGYFEYNHPILKLKIGSINEWCKDCFSNFEANVSDSRRTFLYKTSSDSRSFFVYDYYYKEYKPIL